MAQSVANPLSANPLSANPLSANPLSANPLSESEQIIDLPMALRLAGDNNLDLALVREALAQAEAANDAAAFKFLPWLSAGIGYAKHEGAAQDFAGNVADVNKELSSQIGAVTAQVNLGEAIFEKLAASRLQSAASYGLSAQQNDTLMAAATGYFELVNAVANEGIAREALRISQDYEQQLQRATGVGLANKGDELRVSVQTQRYEVALRQATGAVRVASANLAQVLHLAPLINLKPMDSVAPPVTLVPLDMELGTFVNEALASRPELKASQAAVDAADFHRSEATYGPLIPSVSAQALYGRLRGGPNGILSETKGSQDYALMLGWRIGPGGLLDFSRIDLTESKLKQAKLNDAKLRDDITRQVTVAVETARTASDQMALAQRNVDLADQNLKLSRSRKEFGVAIVLEVIQAQKDLTQARSDYVQARTQYATAQYALARATARVGR